MAQSSIFSTFGANGARLALTFNGLTMNDPTSPANDRIEINRIRPRVQTRTVMDERQHSDGMQVQPAYKSVTTLEVAGRILRPSRAAIFDAARLVAEKLDPALLSRNNPSTQGFLPLDGSAPTADTTNYPSGLIAKRVYARPVEPVLPVIVTGGNTGGRAQEAAAFFLVNFLIRDPRVYLQAESSQSLAATSTVVSNAKADYASWPTITLTAATTAGTLQVNNTTDDRSALYIDLSGIDNQQVVIDMENHKITVAGIRRDDRYLSGEFFELLPGSNTITVNSLTGITGMTMTWRPALAF